MADTMDRRSEGKACSSVSHDRYKRLEALGLCNHCGKTAVKGRKTCYVCVDKQTTHSGTYHFRKILRECGAEDYNLLMDALDDAIRAYELFLGAHGMQTQSNRLNTMYSLRYAVIGAAPQRKKRKKEQKSLMP